MNLTYFQPRKRRNVENNNNCPLNIRFVAKTSDIRNFSQNIRSDVKTSEVATLMPTIVSIYAMHAGCVLRLLDCTVCCE